MELSEDIKNSIKNLVLNEVIKEFVAKGHNLTGKGVKSLDAFITSDLTGITISIMGEPYMAIQNEGRGAGKKMPPISVLEDWVKRRGIASDMKEVRRIAFAIGKNMNRIGMHSDGASGKSGVPNSSKLDLSKRSFFDIAIQKNASKVMDLAFEGIEKNFTTTIQNTFTKAQSTVLWL